MQVIKNMYGVLAYFELGSTVHLGGSAGNPTEPYGNNTQSCVSTVMMVCARAAYIKF